MSFPRSKDQNVCLYCFLMVVKNTTSSITADARGYTYLSEADSKNLQNSMPCFSSGVGVCVIIDASSLHCWRLNNTTTGKLTSDITTLSSQYAPPISLGSRYWTNVVPCKINDLVDLVAVIVMWDEVLLLLIIARRRQSLHYTTTTATTHICLWSLSQLWWQFYTTG